MRYRAPTNLAQAPKAAAADPSEAVSSILAAATGADTASAKIAAFEPILELLNDEASVESATAKSDAILAELAAALSEISALPPADITSELASSVKVASSIIASFCDAGASSHALPTAAPLLAMVVTPPARGKSTAPPADGSTEDAAPPSQPEASWRTADFTEERTALLTSACAALSALASHAAGRLALRKGSAIASLLALMQPAAEAYPALQAQAALALSHLAEAPLCRVALGSRTTLPSLIQLVKVVQATAQSHDALALRLHAKILLLLGFCLYDGNLLSHLLDASLLEAALASLEPVAEEADAEPPSAEAIQCAAELKSNAATVIAIAGQSPSGRERLVACGGLPILVHILAPPASAEEGAETKEAPASPATDQAESALAANVTLAIAHLALSASAAILLARDGTLIPLLAGLLAPPPDDAVPGWAAVRSNACTALLHIVHQKVGREAFLAAQVALGASAQEEVEGDDAQASSTSAVSAVVRILSSALPTASAEGEVSSFVETDGTLIAAAADILSQCSSEADGREIIVAAGGTAALLALLDQQQPDDLLEAVVSALAALAAHPTACVLLRTVQEVPEAKDEDAPPPDPKAGEDQVQEDASQSLPPPLAIVPALLESAHTGLKRAGSALVTACCTDKENAALLIKLKVLPKLILMEADSILEPAARMAVDTLCLAVPSALLWRTGKLPMSVIIADGFWAVTRDTELLAVEDLAMSNAGPEVVHIDASKDAGFARMIETAKEIVYTNSTVGAPGPEAAAALARFVCDHMGGVIEYDAYELYEAPANAVTELRSALGTRVVSLGELPIGAARHRALLFKALADRTGLATSLNVGACIRGAHAHHAWNTMIVDGQVVVVDLMHAPGEFYAELTDMARRYMRVGEYAFSSLTTRSSGEFQLAQQAGG